MVDITPNNQAFSQPPPASTPNIQPVTPPPRPVDQRTFFERYWWLIIFGIIVLIIIVALVIWVVWPRREPWPGSMPQESYWYPPDSGRPSTEVHHHVDDGTHTTITHSGGGYPSPRYGNIPASRNVIAGNDPTVGPIYGTQTGSIPITSNMTDPTGGPIYGTQTGSIPNTSNMTDPTGGPIYGTQTGSIPITSNMTDPTGGLTQPATQYQYINPTPIPSV